MKALEKELERGAYAHGYGEDYWTLEGKGRFYPRRDDVASTAFWYQSEPHAPFPTLTGLNDLEVI